MASIHPTGCIRVAALAAIVMSNASIKAADRPAGVWIRRAELKKLPTEGEAWNRILNIARLSQAIPVLSDQNDMADVETLAIALAAARLDDEALAAKVRANLKAAIGSERQGRVLAVARNIPSIVVAAELVGLPPAEEAAFRKWLKGLLEERLAGKTIRQVHEERPNNWGTHAGAARAAIAVYLGDKAEVARTAQVFKGWLGDRQSYASFKYGDLDWQADPQRPVAINPKGAMRDGHSIDGAQPEELRRGGGFEWPPRFTGYAWEALQGAYVQAEILNRAGYDTYAWEDRALLRAVKFLERVNWPATGDDEWIPFLIDARYGTQTAVGRDPRSGKNMDFTAWTHPRRAAAEER